MPDAHAFLVALAVVLGVAAVTTVVFQRLRQPVVLGYVLAGLVVGPHVPIPLVADAGIIRTLSELGVILLMFALGLEFTVRRLAAVGPVAGVAALAECTIMFWLGYVTGRLFGWTVLESVFTGAIVAISSTTIVAKAFDELRIGGKLRELVVGILVVEDLIAIVLMALLTALARGVGISGVELAVTLGRLALFLGALLAVGMLVVPRAVRWVRHLGRPETTLVAILGLCFGFALLAHELGYSVALGAFIAGSLVGESGERRYVERLVQPVRDMFAAIFFVSVGMSIEPATIVRHAAAVGALAAVVIVGKVASVSFGTFLTGPGPRTAVQAGMSLAQIGEFSFIIAGLGLSLGATRDFLYAVAVAVSAVTALTTPWLIRGAGPAASWIDRMLPRPLQTVATLYGSWLERVRASPRRATTAAEVRRLVRVLAVDAAAIAAIVIAAALAADRGGSWLERRLGVSGALGAWAMVAVAGIAALPFCAGVLRNGRRTGEALAAAALPPRADGGVDLAAAPRRALVLILQFATVALTSLPVVAVTQPFLPGGAGAVVVAALLAALGVAAWRGATNLQGHVRAGAEVMVEALARHARAAEHRDADALAHLREVLPGLGEPIARRLDAASPAVGRTLAALDLRGRTGATVLALWRADGGVMVPGPREELRVGDVLALAGTADAVAAACELLGTPGPPAARAPDAPREEAAGHP